MVGWKQEIQVEIASYCRKEGERVFSTSVEGDRNSSTTLFFLAFCCCFFCSFIAPFPFLLDPLWFESEERERERLWYGWRKEGRKGKVSVEQSKRKRERGKGWNRKNGMMLMRKKKIRNKRGVSDLDRARGVVNVFSDTDDQRRVKLIECVNEWLNRTKDIFDLWYQFERTDTNDDDIGYPGTCRAFWRRRITSVWPIGFIIVPLDSTALHVCVRLCGVACDPHVASCSLVSPFHKRYEIVKEISWTVSWIWIE